MLDTQNGPLSAPRTSLQSFSKRANFSRRACSSLGGPESSRGSTARSRLRRTGPRLAAAPATLSHGNTRCLNSQTRPIVFACCALSVGPYTRLYGFSSTFWRPPLNAGDWPQWSIKRRLCIRLKPATG